MSDVTSIRLAQALGITLSAWMSGAILAVTIINSPALRLAPPSIAVRQWNAMYDRGKTVMPPFGVVGMASLAFLACNARDVATARLYVAAAVATGANIPYTLILMMNTNSKLQALRKAVDEGAEIDGKGSRKGKEARELVGRWMRLNFIRGCLPLGGVIFGLWATLA